MEKAIIENLHDGINNASQWELLELYRLTNSYVGDNEISDDLEDIIRLLYDIGGIKEIVRAFTYSVFNTSNNFFRINNYGNVDSTNDLTDWISAKIVVDNIIEYWEEMGNYEKQKIYDICNIYIEEVA